MFGNQKQSADKVPGNSATLISAGTVLQGDLQSDTNLRIDGTIHGNVLCQAKIVVGPSGFVHGNLEGTQTDVSGRVNGNIVVKELVQLRPGANVEGNINSTQLQIDAGAVFNGQSIMTTITNVVHMNEEELLHAKAN